VSAAHGATSNTTTTTNTTTNGSGAGAWGSAGMGGGAAVAEYAALHLTELAEDATSDIARRLVSNVSKRAADAAGVNEDTLKSVATVLLEALTKSVDGGGDGDGDGGGDGGGGGDGDGGAVGSVFAEQRHRTRAASTDTLDAMRTMLEPVLTKMNIESMDFLVSCVGELGVVAQRDTSLAWYGAARLSSCWSE
jgi:hypothetical protein